jgi:uncharacterized membrane protein YphA (DoxX/SURF4 family)
MRIAMIVVRTLLGLLFLFASITYLFGLVPKPELTGTVKAFNDGLEAVGYFMPLLKVTELLCGLAFVTGRYVPLATVIVAPIVVHIFCFHLFVDRTGLPVAILVVLATAFLALHYRKSYEGLLRAR